MKRLVLKNVFGILPSLAAALACAFAEEQSPPPRPAAAGNTAFACELYAALKTRPGKGSMFFSPCSISAALAMTYAGARGETAAEIARAMHFTLGPEKTHPAFAELARVFDRVREKGAVELAAANSLWPDKTQPLLAEYLALLKAHYGVAVAAVNYRDPAGRAEACRIINAWVEEQTREKIKNLISPEALAELTRLVLVNAVYFKGRWEKPFDPAQTREAEFTRLDGSKQPVRMMHQKLDCGYAELDGAQALELPYAGGDMSMIVVLPESAEAFEKIEGRLSAKNLDAWLGRLSKQSVHVHLPKFRMEWGTVELNEALQSLGIRKAFSMREADFSGMDGARDLYVSKVLHKAFVDVAEEGTEAAAATAVIMALKAAPAPTPVFRADRPFIFLIKENSTGTVLFAGRMTEPGP